MPSARSRWVNSVSRPRWGLGNRVRSLLGARALATAHDRTLLYTWPTGRHFGASMDDLWRFDVRRVPTAVSVALTPWYPYRGPDLDWMDAHHDEAIWQIRTGHELELPTGIDWTDDLRMLRPTSVVEQRVADFHRAHLAARPYVGVMVRAHNVSHAQTREHSPVSWYLDRLRQIRAERPDIVFFVSCDVPAVQRRLISDIGNAYGLDDKGGYNSRDGLRSAVADLYLLAGSAHLVGPHYSSFPELAAHLGGPQLHLETSQTPWASLGSTRLTCVDDPTRPWLRSRC